MHDEINGKLVNTYKIKGDGIRKAKIGAGKTPGTCKHAKNIYTKFCAFKVFKVDGVDIRLQHHINTGSVRRAQLAVSQAEGG